VSQRFFRGGLGMLVVAALTACSSSTWYYHESNLNRLSVGAPKENVLALFPGGERDGHQWMGMQIRAARKTDSGTLLEVGEVPLMHEVAKNVTQYWFVFEDGRLAQWGRPEDWRAVSGRYDIHFNPSPGNNELQAAAATIEHFGDDDTPGCLKELFGPRRKGERDGR
jgi:hypothetical protein